MASSYIRSQGAALSSAMKYSGNSKIPSKNSVKMPSIHATLLPSTLNPTSGHARDLSLGSENRINTLLHHKRVASTTNQKSYDEGRDDKNGPSSKSKYKALAENDSRLNKPNIISNLIHSGDSSKLNQYLKMHYNDNKTETTRLINQKMKDTAAEHSSIMDKQSIMSGRTRKKHLPPIVANPYHTEEANTPSTSSHQSTYQPSPSNRKKTDPTERQHSKKLDEFTPLRGSKKPSSPSPENFYRLEFHAPRGRLDRDTGSKKENPTVVSASFDQDNSYEGSQKTDRSFQYSNHEAGKHGHRQNRRKKKFSNKLESLFKYNTNLNLDDAYERLNQLTNRNTHARQALLKIQESFVEIDTEEKSSRKVTEA